MEVLMPIFERVTDIYAPIGEPIGLHGICKCYDYSIGRFSTAPLWLFVNPSDEITAIIRKNKKLYKFWQSTIQQINK